MATFALQREVNDYPGEPLMAILPGVALQELWGLMGTAEKALFVVSLFVVLTGLIGMLTAILTSLNERRREMAILRSVGARPWHIFGLLLAEAFSLALAGVALGLGLLYLGIAASYVQANTASTCRWPGRATSGACLGYPGGRRADRLRAGLARLPPVPGRWPVDPPMTRRYSPMLRS